MSAKDGSASSTCFCSCGCRELTADPQCPSCVALGHEPAKIQMSLTWTFGGVVAFWARLHRVSVTREQIEVLAGILGVTYETEIPPP